MLWLNLDNGMVMSSTSLHCKSLLSPLYMGDNDFAFFVGTWTENETSHLYNYIPLTQLLPLYKSVIGEWNGNVYYDAALIPILPKLGCPPYWSVSTISMGAQEQKIFVGTGTENETNLLSALNVNVLYLTVLIPITPKFGCPLYKGVNDFAAHEQEMRQPNYNYVMLWLRLEYGMVMSYLAAPMHISPKFCCPPKWWWQMISHFL